MAISRKWQREISFMTHNRTFYNFLAHFLLTVPSPLPMKWQPPLILPSLQMPTGCSGCASCLPSSLTDLDHHHHTHPISLPQTEPCQPRPSQFPSIQQSRTKLEKADFFPHRDQGAINTQTSSLR